MLSKERLESYRRMTPSQRLELSLRATGENIQFLHYGTDDVVKRKFALLNDENEKRNKSILARLASAESARE